jgi:hypothetical protein
MKIEITNVNGMNVAKLVSDNIEIRSTQDALDLMANCYNQKASKLIVDEKNIIPEFFDLKTGILGEILQKFATYNFQIAIVGDFSKYPSKNFRISFMKAIRSEELIL